MRLVGRHAAGCMSFDPNGETDAKKELKAELAKNHLGSDITT